MRRRTLIGWAAGTAVIATAAVTPGAFADTGSGRPDLRVDANRDGRIDKSGTSDERGSRTATVAAGALFLANIDDERHRCKATDAAGVPLADAELAACNDASDTVVNGAQDAEDLARVALLPMPHLGEDATATVTATGPVRLFLRRGAGWRPVTSSDRLTAAELRPGVEFGIEGTDVLRDSAVFDGTTRITVTVTTRGVTSSDTVAMRQAPLLTASTLQPAERLMTTQFSVKQAEESDIPEMAGISAAFVQALKTASRDAGLRKPFVFTNYGEEFPQDLFEPMTESMPGPGGRPHTIRVLLRSHQQDWRHGGRELYERLRGPGIGVVDMPPDDHEGGIGDTLSSHGNFETIPPYGRYPLGRAIMGKARNWSELNAPVQEPSPVQQKLVSAQGLGDTLFVDTGMTFVQHVDELIQFVPADNARGWMMAVADPASAINLLRKAQAAGHGNLPLKAPGQGLDRLTTIDEYLKDGVLVDDNTSAQPHVEANIALLRKEIALRDDEIIRVPVLFATADINWGRDPGESSTPQPLTSVSPNALNGQILNRHHYLAPKQWGPQIEGTDIMAAAVTAAYRKAGLTTSYVDDLQYSIDGGDVHCATNVLRADPGPWWRRLQRP